MGPKKEVARSFNPFASSKPQEPDLETGQRIKLFMAVHWRGVAVVAIPILMTIVFWVSLPIAKSQWVGYTLLVMAGYWVSECLPLAITAFLPIALFPLLGIMDTRLCCSNYMNDTVMMFLGSLIISYSVEQSCLHKRLAYFSIQSIGYSHLRLLMALCCVTCFASMWITNTAATTMMVPINFAVLKVFEDQGVIVMYEKAGDDLVASPITSCYFCAVTFSATCVVHMCLIHMESAYRYNYNKPTTRLGYIVSLWSSVTHDFIIRSDDSVMITGGIGTLVGTGTNLVFKGFMAGYTDKEYLSFPMFSAFAVPYMICLEFCVYMWFAIIFFGFLRPSSQAAKKSVIPLAVQEAAAAVIDADVKKKGSLSYWEGMVVILFGGAMLLFFSRSPQMFAGWGDRMSSFFRKDQKFIKDSALAMIVSFLMFLFPRDKTFFHNFTAKYKEDLPKSRSLSVLNWQILNASCPYAFSFLLGGGFSLSNAAKSSGLNDNLGKFMQNSLQGLPPMLILLVIIIVVIFITNFASNVAVCTVFTPIVMQLARQIKVHPLYYCVASGFSASFCFMIPVGTPGNLIVQSAAKVSTGSMIYCGSGPTATTILITWVCMMFWAPIIWSDVKDFSKFVPREGI